jgi:hypothetical protein
MKCSAGGGSHDHIPDISKTVCPFSCPGIGSRGADTQENHPSLFADYDAIIATLTHSLPNQRSHTMKNNQIRQGDLLLIAVNSLPKSKQTKKSRSHPLLDGEATGHVHAIECDTEIKRLEYNEKELQDPLESLGISATGICGLEVSQPAKLTHQEHSALDVPVGNYIAIRQREYSPEAIRNVAD